MTTNLCPTCHTPIPASAPGGLCPACILRDAEEPALDARSAPDLAQIAAAFPQLENITLIGQGGMGFVYRASQPTLDRTVALKILAPSLSRDPAFAERFAREARVLGKLNHPNIVTVFEHGVAKCDTTVPDAGPAGGVPAPLSFYYLLMEHVDGVNLRQAMRAGRFTPAQALAIVPGICDALQTAHAQGIWHRDIKPENILLDAQGRVKIADFGIARILGDPARDFTLTATGAALGSAAYMAPEQHERPHDVDHRADIYSLGVVIYELLTGELPLGRFPAPSARAAVDARIDEIVFRTLEKERALRQQSAAEVKTDVENVVPDFSRHGAAGAKGAAFPDGAPGGLKSGTTLQLAAKAALVGGIVLFIAAAVFTHGSTQGVMLTIAITAFVLGGLGLLFGSENGRSAPTSATAPDAPNVPAPVTIRSVCLFLAGIAVIVAGFLVHKNAPLVPTHVSGIGMREVLLPDRSTQQLGTFLMALGGIATFSGWVGLCYAFWRIRSGEVSAVWQRGVKALIMLPIVIAPVILLMVYSSGRRSLGSVTFLIFLLLLAIVWKFLIGRLSRAIDSWLPQNPTKPTGGAPSPISGINPPAPVTIRSLWLFFGGIVALGVGAWIYNGAVLSAVVGEVGAIQRDMGVYVDHSGTARSVGMFLIGVGVIAALLGWCGLWVALSQMKRGVIPVTLRGLARTCAWLPVAFAVFAAVIFPVRNIAQQNSLSNELRTAAIAKQDELAAAKAGEESWSYTLRHQPAEKAAAWVDAVAKVRFGQNPAVRAASANGVVTVTGPRERVRQIATELRATIDLPIGTDPLKFPVLNMPPELITRLAIAGLVESDVYPPAMFSDVLLATLAEEQIAAPQLARAFASHVLELEKATYVNSGAPFESIINTPGASVFYDATIPCADQPDKPLTLRIERTTQQIGTQSKFTSIAPWLIAEAKQLSKEPLPRRPANPASVDALDKALNAMGFNIPADAKPAPARTLTQDAATLVASRGKSWRSAILDFELKDGQRIQQGLVMKFDQMLEAGADSQPDASVKLFTNTPPEGPFNASAESGDSSPRNVHLQEKDGVRTMTISRILPPVPGQSERTRQLREQRWSVSFTYELNGDTLILKGFPEGLGDWGISSFIAPKRVIHFQLQP